MNANTESRTPAVAVLGSVNMDLVAYVDEVPGGGETVTASLSSLALENGALCGVCDMRFPPCADGAAERGAGGHHLPPAAVTGCGRRAGLRGAALS